MDAVITNIGQNTNVISGITVGTRVDVAVRGGHGLKHRLGKRLLSHRSGAFAAATYAASPPAMSMPMPASSMRYSPTECSSPRWQASAAFELPPAAWAALVIARAL